MAFVADKDKQAQDQQNNGQFNQANQTNQSAQLASGQGSQIAPQTQPAQTGQQNPTQPKQAGSGRFQNLQKYIQSNQAGAQQIGQRVQSNVNKQANQVGDAVNQAQQNLQQASGQEIGRLNQGSDVINQAVANPTDYADNQDKFNQFQQLRTGQYQAQDIANLSNLQNQVGKVGELANATQSEQGRAGLIKQTFNPQTNYSKGASRLDQLLLQSNPNNLRQVANTAQQAQKEQTGNLTNLVGVKEQYNQQIQDLVNERKQQATQALDVTQQGLVSDVDKRVQEATAKEAQRKAISDKIAQTLAIQSKDAAGKEYSDQDATKEALRLGLENNLLTQEQQATVLDAIRKINSPVQTLVRQVNNLGKSGYLGYGSPGSSTTTYSPGEARYSDLNMRTLLRDTFADQAASPINRQTVTTQADLARANALAKLADQTAVLSGMEQGQAGKANWDINKVNRLVDENIAKLNQDTILDLPTVEQDPSGQIMRTIAPNAEQLAQDTQQDIKLISDKTASPEQRTAAIARLYANAYRAPIGMGAEAGKAAVGDVNNYLNTLLNPSKYATQQGAATLLSPMNGTIGTLTGDINNAINATPGAKQFSQATGTDNTLNSISEALKQGDVGKAATAAFQAQKALSGAQSIANVFKKLCHAVGTLVKMVDGSFKPIEQIEVGEETYLGGKVTHKLQAQSSDMYIYNNVVVDGDHAVYCNGWTRVKLVGERVEGTFDIVPMITENHIICTEETIWSDLAENDNWYLSDEESLRLL